MGTFHILTDVIFVLSDIYQLESAMRKNVFSYSKKGLASAWLDSENYSSTFYLVTLSKAKTLTKEYILNPLNLIFVIEEIRACSSPLKSRIKVMTIEVIR